MTVDRDSITDLKCILSEVYSIVASAPPMPHNGTARSEELLQAAFAIANDLANQQEQEERQNPAAVLGSKGRTGGPKNA